MGIAQTPEARKRLNAIPEFHREHERIFRAAVSDDGPVAELVVPGWIGQLLDKTPAWRNLVALVAEHDLIRKSQKHQLDHPAVEDDLMSHCRSFLGGTLFYLEAANEAHFLGITTPEELGEFQYIEANEWATQAEALTGVQPGTLDKQRFTSSTAALSWFASEYPHYLSWLAQELATSDKICPPVDESARAKRLARLAGSTAIPTDQLARHMRPEMPLGLLSLLIEVGPFRMRKHVAPPDDLGAYLPSLSAERKEHVLKRLHDQITLRLNGDLLKTHMDVTDQAFRNARGKNAPPQFKYDLHEAAERQGYKRGKDGKFEAKTLREMARRVACLNAFFLTIWEEEQPAKGRKKQTNRIESPLWIIKARGSTETISEIGASGLLLDEEESVVPSFFLLEAGLWWPFAEMWHRYWAIPDSLLKLRTDGNGYRKNEIALRLAYELATWARVNAGGGERYIRSSIGKLLEQAGVTNLAELEAMATPTDQKRFRALVAGEPDDWIGGAGGALGLLREHNAFVVEISDDDEFWVTGRGWVRRWWDAGIKVEIKGLEGVTKVGKDGKFLTGDAVQSLKKDAKRKKDARASAKGKA